MSGPVTLGDLIEAKKLLWTPLEREATPLPNKCRQPVQTSYWRFYTTKTHSRHWEWSPLRLEREDSFQSFLMLMTTQGNSRPGKICAQQQTGYGLRNNYQGNACGCLDGGSHREQP
jgi:hypothetical protein